MSTKASPRQVAYLKNLGYEGKAASLSSERASREINALLAAGAGERIVYSCPYCGANESRGQGSRKCAACGRKYFGVSGDLYSEPDYAALNLAQSDWQESREKALEAKTADEDAKMVREEVWQDFRDIADCSTLFARKPTKKHILLTAAHLDATRPAWREEEFLETVSAMEDALLELFPELGESTSVACRQPVPAPLAFTIKRRPSPVLSGWSVFGICAITIAILAAVVLYAVWW